MHAALWPKLATHVGQPKASIPALIFGDDLTKILFELQSIICVKR